SSRRRHTRSKRDWSSDVCSSDLIFDGLGINPLEPNSISFLLWLLMGYLLATSVLVVAFGRLGDQHGRARLFNLGFLIFTVGSIRSEERRVGKECSCWWLSGVGRE